VITANHLGKRWLSVKLVMLLVGSFHIMLFSCKANQTQEITTQEIAVKELGKDFSLTLNENKTYALYQQKRMDDHSDRIIKYIVIYVSRKDIVTRGSFQSGYVKWITNDSIEVATSDKSSPDLIKQTIHINSNEQ